MGEVLTVDLNHEQLSHRLYVKQTLNERMEEHDCAHCKTGERVRRSHIKLTSCSEHDLPAYPSLSFQDLQVWTVTHDVISPVFYPPVFPTLPRSRPDHPAPIQAPSFSRSSTSQPHTPQHPPTFPSHRSSCHELCARMLIPAC